MKIVFLDAKTIGEDIDLSGFDALGEVVKYGFSTKEEARERAKDADVLVLNKVEVDEYSVGEAGNLKLVCVTATGTNNLDKDYLDRRGIAWRNVAGYSTETVAQHTFALLFYLTEKLRYYDDYVKSGKYVNDVTFTHFDNVFHELSGKTWGVIGLGAIGRRVADIAGMFGCRVIYYSTSGKNVQPDYERVEFEELLASSDIVSVHAPLNEQTAGLMDRRAFSAMKESAVFLNLGRGPIVVEADLADYKQLFRQKNAAMHQFDVFYHFAWSGTVGEARNDMHLQTGNIAYTMDAVELAERLGCHTFIGAGSQAEYGRVDGKLTPDLPAHPENGYGMAKLCAGQMSRVVCAKKKMRHIWTRILSVYGPYDGSGSMVMSAVRKIGSGEAAAFTPGGQMWDYLYSRDAAQIFYALAEKGTDGAVYCIGSGQARELKSYIKDIDNVLQEYRGEVIKETEEEQEARLGIGRIPYAEKQVMYLCADTTLLEKQIGQIPHTDFKEGIRSILETGFI